jgi:hypothetical protein
MKNKDQFLLEDLYSRILKENESVKGWREDPLGLEGDPLGLKYNPNTSNDEHSGVDVKKVVHDILNEIQPHVFDLDRETYKEAIKTLIDRLNLILQRY